MPHLFYMVTVDAHPGTNSQVAGAPTKRYDDVEPARKEAERLSAKEGRTAYLLQAIEVVIPPPGVWSKLEPKAQ